MNALILRPTVWWRRCVAVLLLCGGLSEAGWSQPAHANGGPANGITLPSAADLAKAVPLGAQATRAAMDSAKTLAKGNDIVAADQGAKRGAKRGQVSTLDKVTTGRTLRGWRGRCDWSMRERVIT